MNIEQLKEELGNLEDALLSVSGSELEDIKSYADEIHDQSYSMQCSADDVISSVDSVQSDINTLKGQLDELEGFDVDKVKEDMAKELALSIRDEMVKAFDTFINDILIERVTAWNNKQTLKEAAKKPSSSDES
mgnify:FL=1|tara:strand:+ start:288 stop:686 length:399 start_codon:yes stop_codon:yes gene_type:complete